MNEHERRPTRELLLLAGAAIALQAIAWALLLALFTARIGYGLHDLSDTFYYLSIAVRVAHGAWPYVDFPFEYPPLALPFFLLPSADGTVAAYEYWFAVEMIAICMATAVVVALVAARVWGGLGRPLGAAAAFAAAVVMAGAISVNRFDPAVGLVVALCVLALVYRRFTLAGVAVGLGFGIKLVPIVLLPLVLVLAARRRPVLGAAAAAIVVSAVPYMPFLVRSWSAFNRTLGYQTGRGLHIESVPATPYLIWKALRHGAEIVIVPPSGSLVIGAPGTLLLARVSPFVVLGLLAVAYAGIWRARAVVRNDPEWVAPAALAVLLAFMCGNKVLSPQHLLWTLPLVALCLAAKSVSHRVVGVVMLVAIALTQVEFPAMYYDIKALDALPLLIVSVRNVLLLTALVIAVVSLWRVAPARECDLPAGPPASSSARPV
jgi:Glycosyltransferase family 87